jgi:hypothetical protein
MPTMHITAAQKAGRPTKLAKKLLPEHQKEYANIAENTAEHNSNIKI